MRTRIVLTLLTAGALLVGGGVAVHVASADEPSKLTATYSQVSFWEGGLIGKFTINNPSAEAAHDWKLSFTLPDGATVAGAWNGTVSGSNGRYLISPTVETKTLAGHGSVTVGFTAMATASVVPVKCTINGKDCTIETSSSTRTDGNVVNQPGDPGAGSSTPPPGTSPAGAAAPGSAGPKPAQLPASSVTPYVDVLAGARPPLKAIALGAGARALTLVYALPSTAGCELKWGGTVDLTAYAQDITDALNNKVGLVVSIGSTSGVDLARVCGSVPALKAALTKVLDLGVRSLDITIPSDLAADGAVNSRLAQAVKELKAQFRDLNVAYTLPVPLNGALAGALETLTTPLSVAKNAGAVIDRVNIMPVDFASPLSSLNSVLSTIGLGNTVDGLLATATGVHNKIMSLRGVDSATAWRMLGVVPVIGGNELLGKTAVLDSVVKLTAFAKANGLGLVGFLPLNTDLACASGGTGGALLPLPVLSCLDPNILSRFFAVTALFNHLRSTDNGSSRRMDHVDVQVSGLRPSRNYEKA